MEEEFENKHNSSLKRAHIQKKTHQEAHRCVWHGILRCLMECIIMRMLPRLGPQKIRQSAKKAWETDRNKLFERHCTWYVKPYMEPLNHELCGTV